MYLCLVGVVKRGMRKTAVIVVLCSSPVPLAILALTVEHRPFSWMFNLVALPLSLTIGDSVILSRLAWVAAGEWHCNPPEESVLRSRWLTIAFLVLGFCVGSGFHWVDSQGYHKLGLAILLASILKKLHDFGTFSILFGGLSRVAWPLVLQWRTRRRAVFMMLICVVIWAGLLAFDANRGLDPRNFHDVCTYDSVVSCQPISK